MVECKLTGAEIAKRWPVFGTEHPVDYILGQLSDPSAGLKFTPPMKEYRAATGIGSSRAIIKFLVSVNASRVKYAPVTAPGLLAEPQACLGPNHEQLAGFGRLVDSYGMSQWRGILGKIEGSLYREDYDLAAVRSKGFAIDALEPCLDNNIQVARLVVAGLEAAFGSAAKDNIETSIPDEEGTPLSSDEQKLIGRFTGLVAVEIAGGMVERRHLANFPDLGIWRLGRQTPLNR